MDIIGKTLKIIRKINNPSYNGLVGIVTNVDKSGFIYGTWGVEPVNPMVDIYQLS